MPGVPGRSGGRNAKPPALKILQGNPGKRRIKAAPVLPIDHDHAPDEPEWSTLLPSEENTGARHSAGAEWARVVPVLEVVGLLTTIDLALLTDYCLCWARLQECERRLSVEGLVVATEKGPVRNPLSVTAREYRTALRGYIAELGLGPSARGRMDLPAQRPRTAGDDLLS